MPQLIRDKNTRMPLEKAPSARQYVPSHYPLREPMLSIMTAGLQLRAIVVLQVIVLVRQESLRKPLEGGAHSQQDSSR